MSVCLGELVLASSDFYVCVHARVHLFGLRLTFARISSTVMWTFYIKPATPLLGNNPQNFKPDRPTWDHRYARNKYSLSGQGRSAIQFRF